jgi:PIN domain nuclease of toxin-antitoxin system
MILLDTHVFVWLAEDSPKLGHKARQRIDRAMVRRQVHVSAISYWELGMLVAARRLRLARDLADVRAAAERGGPRELAVDGEISIVASRLSALNGDPADRIIVATALCVRATLLTADKRLLGMRGGPACVDASR